MKNKNKSIDLERILVEDTRVVDLNKINFNDELDENTISQMSIEEITYALEAEDHTSEVKKLLKKYLKQKQ